MVQVLRHTGMISSHQLPNIRYHGDIAILHYPVFYAWYMTFFSACNGNAFYASPEVIPVLQSVFRITQRFVTIRAIPRGTRLFCVPSLRAGEQRRRGRRQTRETFPILWVYYRGYTTQKSHCSL